MDLNAVYKKTQKGQEEMAQRTVLGMRERTLLVMVDGKTTAADLLAKAHHMPDPQGLLAKLINGGFIATDASPAPATGTTAAAASPPAAPESATAPAPAPAVTVQPSMQEAVRFARRYLNDALGPDADMLVEAIEKCKTPAELRIRMEKTRQALAGGAGKRRAEEFWAGVEVRLPPA
jgi:hypothetical protein